jgi:hypothetical protein
VTLCRLRLAFLNEVKAVEAASTKARSPIPLPLLALIVDTSRSSISSAQCLSHLQRIKKAEETSRAIHGAAASVLQRK